VQWGFLLGQEMILCAFLHGLFGCWEKNLVEAKGTEQGVKPIAVAQKGGSSLD